MPIGNPGNAPDSDPSGYGSAAYAYRMGTTEVTNSQYVAFLNAMAATDTYGLYSMSMSLQPWGGITQSGSSGSYTYAVKTAAQSGTYPYGDKPVVYVSSGDAMRFANWLHNGQGSGSTETGAYNLNGAVSNAALAAVTRQTGATWFLPTENEWYKAAYHDKTAGTAGTYFDYPTGTNSAPDNNLPSSDTGNSANFYGSNYTTGNSSYPLTDAGAYAISESPYGTFDQGGNVWEWNETLFSGSFRGFRGGAWRYNSDSLHASSWSYVHPTYENSGLGFRDASIPEPGSYAIAVSAAVGFWWLKRRRS